MNFYNEHDPNAAAWLRELIARRLIPAGVVDERSITDIQPHELHGYTQCHFFAGIGGWSLALRLAGWPDTEPVWTGSCPCQPFSVAGKGLGDKDERHLWPVFSALIAECRPQCVFGEQVASAIGKGWLDGVSADLEANGYACGSAVLGAHSVNAPHQRQRLFWVADATSGGFGIFGDAAFAGSRGRNGEAGGSSAWSSGMDHSTGPRCDGEKQETEGNSRHEARLRMSSEGCGQGFWAGSRIIHCRDGKFRRIPVEPSLFPLADGLPYKLARRGSIRPALLKGAGNAIVPQVAAEFVAATIDALNL